MKKNVLLLFFSLLFYASSQGNDKITGFVIVKNEYSINKIIQAFPNIAEITLVNCDLSKYNLSSFDKIQKVNIDHCYGNNILISEKNYNIREIYINNCQINTLSHTFFSNLVFLEKLYIGDTPISNIDFNDSDSLKDLSLFATHLKSLETISKSINLQTLYLRQHTIDFCCDITELSKLDKLVDVNLSANFSISNNTVIESVKDLYISSTIFFSNSAFLSSFPNLVSFSINGWNVSKLPNEIYNLKKLKSLAILFTNLVEFPSDLLKLPSLESLDFENNKVIEFSKDLWLPRSFHKLTIQNEGFDFNYYQKKYPSIIIEEGNM